MDQRDVCGGPNGNDSVGQQVPGWEDYNIDHDKSKLYNSLLKYANLEIATLQMISEPPLGFEIFKDLL